MLTTLLSLAALALSGPAGGEERAGVPFADFGRAFVERHCAKPASSPCPIDEVRASHFAHGAFGVVDVAYPAAALEDKQRAEDLRAIVAGLVEMQSRWIDRVAAAPAEGAKAAAPSPAAAAAKADLAALGKWVAGWKPAALAKAKGAEAKDLFALLGAPEEVRAASKQARDFLLDPKGALVVPRDRRLVRIVLAPGRRDFFELAGYAGLVDPALQAQLWTPSTEQWTNFWLGWDLVLALEYPPWKEDPRFESGLSMNKLEPDGMVQHVVQQAMGALLWLAYGEGDSHHLQQALALETVIEVCGAGNALEGDGGISVSGGTSAPYERFVPGGNSAGGSLPPMPVVGAGVITQGSWREGRGSDHFVGPLRKGQKNGAKLVFKDPPKHLENEVLRDKAAHFQLTGSDGASKHVVTAPFLGRHANARPYPPVAFLIDYREFFRAYRTAFVHWLSIHGDPAGPAASAGKLAELLRRLHAGREGGTLEANVTAVYGMPLSAKSGGEPSLEWRFLEWLEKGK
jgi:hypothetical protein